MFYDSKSAPVQGRFANFTMFVAKFKGKKKSGKSKVEKVMPVLSVAPNNPSLDIPVDEEILPVPATRTTPGAAYLPIQSEAEGRGGDPASPPARNDVPLVQFDLTKASPAAAQDIPSHDSARLH